MQSSKPVHRSGPRGTDQPGTKRAVGLSASNTTTDEDAERSRSYSVLTPEGVGELLRLGEGQRIEFKQRTPHEKRLAKLMAAFANSEGGWLFVGVADAGQVVGLSGDEARQAARTIEAVGQSLFGRRVPALTATLDGREIVYAEIDQVDKDRGPVGTADGRFYVREGSATVDASERLLAPSTPTGRALARQQGNASIQTLTIFVAMSFRQEEDPALEDYFEAMKRAARVKGFKLTVTRADMGNDDYEMSQRVLDLIDEADVVIADLTLNSSNVYYELGYARGRRIPVIQTARVDTDLAFDTKTWRTTIYRNATELQKKIRPRIEEACISSGRRKPKS